MLTRSDVLNAEEARGSVIATLDLSDDIFTNGTLSKRQLCRMVRVEIIVAEQNKYGNFKRFIVYTV